MMYSRCAENIRMYIVLLGKDKGDNSLWESCLLFCLPIQGTWGAKKHVNNGTDACLLFINNTTKQVLTHGVRLIIVSYRTQLLYGIALSSSTFTSSRKVIFLFNSRRLKVVHYFLKNPDGKLAMIWF